MTKLSFERRLTLIGGLLILLGGIASSSNMPWGGIGGWTLMVVGVGVLIYGVSQRARRK